MSVHLYCLSTSSISYYNTVDSIRGGEEGANIGKGTLLVCTTKHVPADSNKNRRKCRILVLGVSNRELASVRALTPGDGLKTKIIGSGLFKV
jgi:hypothetical protein